MMSIHRIDEGMVRRNVLRLASIGQDETGAINRVFGSDFVNEERKEVISYFEECGMMTSVDSVGNVHGYYRPAGTMADEILLGSHLDSVKAGGMFDGTAGLVAAAECVRMLSETRYPSLFNLHVVATNGEEGNELGGTFGSRAMMGLLPLDDRDFLIKAEKYGYSGDRLRGAVMDTSKCRGWLGLHIEQGNRLNRQHRDVGIVTGIVGLQRYHIKVTGKSNHAGTTMMEERQDALVEASRIIGLADQLIREYGHHMVATIGEIHVFPNVPTVIPGKVDMVLEVRGLDRDLIERYVVDLSARIQPSGRVHVSNMVKKDPVVCDERFMKAMEKACGEDHISFAPMSSGATHDGNSMAKKMPIAMIFVPSRDGLSHCKEEWTDWDQLTTGVQVLYDTLRSLIR